MTKTKSIEKPPVAAPRYSVEVEREGESGLESLRLPAVGKATGKTAWIERQFSHYAFSFVVSGSGELYVNRGAGRPVAAPSVFYLRPGITYRYGPHPDNSWHERFVACEGRRVIEWTDLGWWPEDPGPYPISDPDSLADAHQKLFEELQSAIPGASDRAKLAWERLVYDLHFCRVSLATGSSAIGERVEQWRLLPERAWDMRKEAEYCGLSYSRFRESFRARFGIAPHCFLTKLRMSCAARLLVQTDQPIKKLASDLGYSSLEGFYRAFRNTHGLAPGAFRRQRRF
jgi:AraC-like DNA-binding protein